MIGCVASQNGSGRLTSRKIVHHRATHPPGRDDASDLLETLFSVYPMEGSGRCDEVEGAVVEICFLEGSPDHTKRSG